MFDFDMETEAVELTTDEQGHLVVPDEYQTAWAEYVGPQDDENTESVPSSRQ